jgi:hypothetical protein
MLNISISTRAIESETEPHHIAALGSNSTKMMQLLAPPFPQHWLEHIESTRTLYTVHRRFGKNANISV